MAQGGNGVDLGAVYQLVSEMAQTVRSHGNEFDHIHRDLAGLQRNVEDLTTNVADLRAAVTEYHATVAGTAFSTVSWSIGSGASSAT